MSRVVYQDRQIRFDRPRSIRGLGLKPLDVHERTLTAADLTTAGAAQTISIAQSDAGLAFPANSVILAAEVVVDEPFDAPAASELLVDVGNASNADRLVEAESVHESNASAGDVLFDGGDTGIALIPALTAYAPAIVFTSTGGNVSTYTEGRLRVRIYHWRFGHDEK
jgi:hypothetical protein